MQTETTSVVINITEGPLRFTVPADQLWSLILGLIQRHKAKTCEKEEGENLNM